MPVPALGFQALVLVRYPQIFLLNSVDFEALRTNIE
jgi:hypothetical protein